MREAFPLRPLLPADVDPLRELVAQSIEGLTQDDYDEDQRLAWISLVENAAAFAKRLAKATTLVALAKGRPAGFASLVGNETLDMLYVHPDFAGRGAGATLVDALERLAKGRGSHAITVKASDTAEGFFRARGYVPQERSMVPVEGQWLSNTTMKKALA